MSPRRPATQALERPASRTSSEAERCRGPREARAGETGSECPAESLEGLVPRSHQPAVLACQCLGTLPRSPCLPFAMVQMSAAPSNSPVESDRVRRWAFARGLGHEGRTPRWGSVPVEGSGETPCPFYLVRGGCKYLPYSSRLLHRARHRQSLPQSQPADETCPGGDSWRQRRRASRAA